MKSAGGAVQWIPTDESAAANVPDLWQFGHGEWMRTPLTDAGCEDPSANLREIS